MGKVCPLRRIFLTFDDGLSHSCLRAGEFLVSRGIKATFFVVPGWIERSCLFNDKHNPSGAHLTWSQCEYLLSMGHSIGSHSGTHRDLVLATEDEVVAEIATGKREVESRLGVNCRGFASPYNCCNETILRVAAQYHEFVRVGPHLTPELLRMELSYPVFPSMSYRKELLDEIDVIGLDCLTPIIRKGAAILQCHGFDGEGWGSVPFSCFVRFVSEYEELLGKDDMINWFTCRSG